MTKLLIAVKSGISKLQNTRRFQLISSKFKFQEENSLVQWCDILKSANIFLCKIYNHRSVNCVYAGATCIKTLDVPVLRVDFSFKTKKNKRN